MTKPNSRRHRHGRAIAAGMLVGTALLGVSVLRSAPAAKADSLEASIDMSSYHYQPAQLQAVVGQTVVWTNDDDAPHDVHTTNAPIALSSPQLENGDQWAFTFTVPGVYHYLCTVHPDMKGTLTVLALAQTQAAPAATPPQPAQPATAAPTTPAQSGQTPMAPSHAAATSAAPAGQPSATPAPATPGAATSSASAPKALAPALGAPAADPPAASALPVHPVSAAPSGGLASAGLVRASGSSADPGPLINPLLFLAAVAAGVVVFALLMIGLPHRGDT